jgi:hypothetical protein
VSAVPQGLKVRCSLRRAAVLVGVPQQCLLLERGADLILRWKWVAREAQQATRPPTALIDPS